VQKQALEEQEKFKSHLQQEFKNSDFDIHRRKLQLVEDESRVKNDLERYRLLEKQSLHNEKLAKDYQIEIKETQEQLRKLMNENKDLSEQLRTLNENLRRESEQANHLGKQNVQFKDENGTYKHLLQTTQQALDDAKKDQKSLIDNLRLQLDETHKMLEKQKTEKDH